MLLKILTGAALSVAITAGSAEARPDMARTADMADSLCAVLQPGDLVFKGARTAIWTEIAAGWSDQADRRWGHVGLVYGVRKRSGDSPVSDRKSGGCTAEIVHADTGTGNPATDAGPGEEIGEVRAVRLVEFLGDVDHAGIFRLTLSPDQRARMIAWAGQAADRHTPFDRGYNLASENNLYCTELIWRAMSAGLGRDAIPEKSTRLGRTYVALSDLSLHPLAQEVMDVDWAE
ncbi:MAG: YiiX/YebB-like N1pC/P60 family cysteine hydrolase [Henriciella sp.]|uniref:YiiX/YebB-like N1pC/P60 family cysteine hydrolase n=1 Tax=Henriciella sp. TaxID=1968823 RepID=UPI0032EC2FB9